MNMPRHHHFVPRFYSKVFAPKTPKGLLSMTAFGMHIALSDLQKSLTGATITPTRTNRATDSLTLK